MRRRDRWSAPPATGPDPMVDSEHERTARLWSEIVRLARVLVPAAQENRFSARITEAYRSHQG